MALDQIADRIVETDMLVIGGGLAGCPAAIKAAESGLDVIQPDTRTYTTGMFLGRSKRWTSLEDKYESKR